MNATHGFLSTSRRLALPTICFPSICLCATLSLLASRAIAIDTAEELAVGRALDKQRLLQHILVLDEQASRRLKEIGQAVAKQSGRADFAFTFRILNDPQVNAFTTAGGYVYIQSGLLDFCESEDELAAVLAHEIVHVSNAHLIKFHDQMRKKAINAELTKFLIGLALQAGGAAAGASTGVPNASGDFQKLGGQVADVIGVGIIDPATKASILGYGKDEELEADRKAVAIMIKAGYDPNALVRFLEKLQKLRDRMIADREPLATALINAEPGLEERVKLLKATVTRASDQPPAEN
jgi:predicted Zn-dependent protease